jgi:GH24 family phage-related lysozyme (muramidase)
MNRRTALFEVVKPFTPEGRYTPEMVKALDALADMMQLPREDAPAGLTASPVAVENIKAFESSQLKAYPDPGTGGDPWTIGWGATGAGIRKGVVWTQQQADQRLAQDVAHFSVGVAKALDGAPTTQAQFDALVSFAYNVGLQALAESTLLRLHKAGDFAGAAA